VRGRGGELRHADSGGRGWGFLINLSLIIMGESLKGE